MAKAIPGARWDRHLGFWVLDEERATPLAMAMALRLFPELAIEYPAMKAAADRYASSVRPFNERRPDCARVDAPEVEKALAQDGHQFYDFQALDLGFLTAVLDDYGGAYLGWERGLGKTLGTCAIVEATKARRVMVVAPKTAKGPVWESELSRFLPSACVVVLPNPKADRDRSLDALQRNPPAGTVVLVVHYEQLFLIGGEDGRGWTRFGIWDLVVADEAHRLKNPKAKLSRAIKKVPSNMRLALSGSIIENHLEELFSPLQWLFPTRYQSQWRDWNDRFVQYATVGRGKKAIGVKADRLGALQDELGRFMVYRRKEDELDLPPRTDQTLYVDLSADQRASYIEMLTKGLAELPDGSRVEATHAFGVLSKLRQISSGIDLLSNQVRDSTKLDLAVELIADAEDEAFVVFTWYKAMAYALADRLGEGFVATGDTNHEKRTAMIGRFQKGEGRVFIGTLSTLGESVNLQRASQVIMLERAWNPSANTQAEDRVFRIGQEKPVTVTHVIARDTVDELRILPTITSKDALRSTILGG